MHRTALDNACGEKKIPSWMYGRFNQWRNGIPPTEVTKQCRAVCVVDSWNNGANT